MKEWDLDSYGRKWRHTCGLYRVGEELKQGWYEEFYSLGRGNHVGVMVATFYGDEEYTRYALEKPFQDLPTASIEYYPLNAGWYVHKSGAALITRKHVRGFQIGLSENNHNLWVYDNEGRLRREWARFMLVDLLRRPQYQKFDPDKPFGIMTDKLWWGHGTLNYLTKTIGVLAGTKLHVEDKTFVPFIKPYVEDMCQIVS